MSRNLRCSRREALGILGAAAGAVAFLGCGGDDATTTTSDGRAATGDAASGSSCILDPNVTKGPYWVDVALNRSDIRSDSNGVASPNPRPGLPLVLRFLVSAYDGGTCTPLSGAQVDIWHCDATGMYSEVAGQGTTGQNFLRGYQVTDASGAATFTTIYPGWYTGRTVHIHVKVRLFDGSSNTTTEATTQIFFDDAVTDSVYATAAPYNTRGARDVRNAADNIYDDQTQLLLTLDGDAVAGFTGIANIAIQVGTVSPG